jgi:hypothetical protein
MNIELIERISSMSFGERTQFVFALRKIAGDVWENVDDVQEDAIYEALELIEGGAK